MRDHHARQAVIGLLKTLNPRGQAAGETLPGSASASRVEEAHGGQYGTPAAGVTPVVLSRVLFPNVVLFRYAFHLARFTSFSSKNRFSLKIHI